MNQDKFLYYSLGIGFFIVALVFFYEDYSPLFAGSGTNATPVEKPVEDSTETEQTEAPPTVSKPTAPKGNTYTVIEGDTAYSIAADFNLDIKELLALNPGKIIDAGTKTKEGKPIYIVKSGEVLVVKKPGQ